MVEEIFKELGFSERETKVYLALLELGQTSVGPIAAKTRIQHSKIYPTLEKLIDKGLVSYVIKSKTKYFQAINPKQIINILKEKEHKFLDILPSLLEKQEFSKEQQIATIYEGYEAIKSMFNLIIEQLDKQSHYYVFAFKDEYISSEIVSIFLRNIHQQLAKKRVDDRLIAHISIEDKVRENYKDIKKMKIKFTKIDFPLGLMIINDKIINWVWGKRPTAVEIISKQIAEQYKNFFLNIWNSS